MFQVTISQRQQSTAEIQPVEMVERKGLGHPDTICDALAEQASRILCQTYLEKFGFVMHHNVDKALLWGGLSLPRFGGGEVRAPLEIFLAGRATCEYKGVVIPVEELIREHCTGWLQSSFHALDPQRHVKFHTLIRPGSADLVELYSRQEQTGVALANDTSCGVGYAPLSELERVVLAVEKTLNTPNSKATHPEFGEDIKVMGVRNGQALELTVACAFVDRHVSDLEDYVTQRSELVSLVEQTVRSESSMTAHVSANAADDIQRGSLYLTVTGTSAEAGDDGEVGRGNRVNGLITPYRPMNMEAAAGKNPVTHVGKLYNIVARRVAETLVEEIEEVSEAYCYLVSRIGSPITEPQVADLQLALVDAGEIGGISHRAEQILRDQLSEIHQIRQQLIDGSITVY
jgi:S-adenosylmethionine synthetase